MRRVAGARSTRPRTSSSSTTRPTSSATSPSRSRRPTRTSPPRPVRMRRRPAVPPTRRPTRTTPTTTATRTRRAAGTTVATEPRPAGRMQLSDAELLESREILPGQWLQSYRAPWLVGGARAGQFVHVRTPDYSGLVLRRPFSLNTVDRAEGTVTIHFRVTGRGTDWMARARAGDRLEMLGPLGRPFEVDRRTHHILLVAGGLGMAGVRALADECLDAGRRVTLLFGARSAAQVYPSSLLPPEVEYVVATDDGSLGQAGRVTDLVAAYEAWADQAFACGPWPMLAALARLAAGRDGRPRRAL